MIQRPGTILPEPGIKPDNWMNLIYALEWNLFLMISVLEK
jgi:hypothetical protein